MSDDRFKRRKILGWDFTLHRRERTSLRTGEYKLWMSKEDPKRGYRSRDLLLWWWSTGRGILTESLEFEIRVSNGEMKGISFSASLPWLVHVSAKLGLPEWLISWWVLDAREFSFALGGYKFVEFRFAYDDDHMRSYYKEKIARGEERPDYVGRFALVQGLKLSLSRWRVANLLFGKSTVEHQVIETGEAIVPMPEGSYPAVWERERMTWRRSRLPFILSERTSVNLNFSRGIPVPGKGENSWDCDDDAVYGVSGSTLPDAIGNAVRSAMRSRTQYAGPNWIPSDGWPKELVRSGAGEQDG